MTAGRKIIRDCQEDPQQERRRRQGHVRCDLPRRATYDRARVSGILSRAAVCRIFGIDPAQITDHVEFDPALSMKFTIYRRVPSGSPGDADIFGTQQYGPLLDAEVPDG
jgi:hypothetical protein